MPCRKYVRHLVCYFQIPPLRVRNDKTAFSRMVVCCQRVSIKKYLFNISMQKKIKKTERTNFTLFNGLYLQK